MPGPPASHRGHRLSRMVVTLIDPQLSIRNLALRRQIRQIDPVTRDPRVSAVGRQISRDFGILAPPFALHSPAPEVLFACWMIFAEPTFGPRVDRATKEAVVAAVSTLNACPYCVDAHTTMLHALGNPASAAAIASADIDRIADSALRERVSWALAHHQPGATILGRRPFPDGDAPEMIGVALAFHYVNRMVNIFVSASPFPFGSTKVRPLARRMAVPVFRRMASRRGGRGASLDFLPPAALPDDLAWAAGDPVIAEAFGRAAAAFDAAGRQALPDAVRELVTTRLGAWHGEEPGVSRAWVDSAVEALDAPQRPLGRLALLAAFASYQVDAQVLRDARPQPGPQGDETLVAAAGWASFAAARRVGSWL